MAILSIILTFLTPILKQCWTYILVVIVCFVAWNKFSRWMQDPKPDPVTTERVLKVDNPALITVRDGLLGRRTAGIALWGIEVPSEQIEIALNQLKNYVKEDDTITVEKKGSYYKVISKGVYVNKELILSGNAKLNQDDSELLAAQKTAQKAKLGIWHDYKPHWFEPVRIETKGY